MAATGAAARSAASASSSLCFFGSAALRLTDNGWALAQGIGEAGGEPRRSPPTTEAATRCSPRSASARRSSTPRRRASPTAAQTLNVAEAKLAEQLAAFEKAQENLEKTLALADEAAERDIARMTTVYENMKPADAARIFERMDVALRRRPARADAARGRGRGADRHEGRQRLRGDADHRQPQRRGPDRIGRGLKLS